MALQVGDPKLLQVHIFKTPIRDLLPNDDIPVENAVMEDVSHSIAVAERLSHDDIPMEADETNEDDKSSRFCVNTDCMAWELKFDVAKKNRLEKIFALCLNIHSIS